MKIAITSPTNWPYVRRGAERFINELARYLAARGHDVTVICGKPGRTEITKQDGYKTIYCRRWWHPALAKFGLLEFHMFFFPCLRQLLRERYDSVLCLTFMDAFAALVARKWTGTEYAFVVNGIPPRKQYFRSLTLRGAVFGRAVLKADAVVGISSYVSSYLENRWGRECIRLPIPLDAVQFHPSAAAKTTRPTVLCAAALDDARKGGRVLMDAFNLLKERCPDAVLQIASTVSPELAQQLLDRVRPAFRSDVEMISATADLPLLFAAATVSVLPSMGEPFGMVVLESMAAGTPVVGTHDGALPELITGPEVGRLFDKGEDADVETTNAAGLAQALVECIDLAADPATVRRCRERAAEFGWAVIGPHYEQLLRDFSLDERSVMKTAGMV